MVLGTVVEAHQRGAADGIAHKNRHKNELDVHQHAVGRHAVLAHQLHELEVVEHGNERAGNVAHQLRGAVETGLSDGRPLQPGRGHVQQAGIGPEEIEKRNQAPHALAQARGNGRTGHAPAEYPHKQGVKNHVGHTGGHRDVKAQLGLLRRDKKALEYVLQHERHGEGHDDPAVEDAVADHLVGGAEKIGHRPDENHAHRRKHQAQQHRSPDHHGKHPVGPGLIAFAQNFRHQRGAAGAQHKTHAAQHHNKGHNQVDGRKAGLADKVGHEQPVHHTVDGREHHHHDGREHKTQQLGEGKMIGKLNFLLAHLVPPMDSNSLERAAL